MGQKDARESFDVRWLGGVVRRYHGTHRRLLASESIVIQEHL